MILRPVSYTHLDLVKEIVDDLPFCPAVVADGIAKFRLANERGQAVGTNQNTVIRLYFKSPGIDDEIGVDTCLLYTSRCV